MTNEDFEIKGEIGDPEYPDSARDLLKITPVILTQAHSVFEDGSRNYGPDDELEEIGSLVPRPKTPPSNIGDMRLQIPRTDLSS